MNTEMNVLNTIQSLILDDLKCNSTFKLKENIGPENSIVVKTSASAYRPESETLFARIKTSGTTRYISVSSRYLKEFQKVGVATTFIKSQKGYVRIALSDWDEFIQRSPDNAKRILSIMFTDMFRGEAFGCCSRYERCSDERKCVHDDLAYATACQYRSNLEAGKIFYGKNKNI